MIKHTFKICSVEYTRNISPSKAIKYFCKDCSGDGYNGYANVNECHLKDCPLWPFRTGKLDPEFAYAKRKFSKEQKEAMANRMKKTQKKIKKKKAAE